MDAFLACDLSLADATRRMAGWQAEARVVEEGGVLLVVGKSRFPTPYSNALVPVATSFDASAVLARAEALFTDRRFFVWARGADGGELGRVAGEHGYAALGDTPAMVIDEPVRAPPAHAPSVELVAGAPGFSRFVEVVVTAYAEMGLPRHVGESLLLRADAAVGDAIVAVARVDGEPVAGALSFVAKDAPVGGVYWVGTTPAARRKGAGDAVTRAVTNAAFERGAKIVTLQASAAGEPVYAAMGYRVVGRYARFLSPAG